MDEPSPRFRQDLVASATEADGVAFVDVSDPKTGTKFRFYDYEYQLALQLNGQPVADVVAWASQVYGIDLNAAGVTEFAGRLAELGFLEKKPDEAAPEPSEITDMSGPSEALESGPSEALESAEAEWMSPQGAQTATFVPDFAMLSSPDRTPVAPEAPILEALAAASERTPPPRDARGSLPGAPRPPAMPSTASAPVIGSPAPPAAGLAAAKAATAPAPAAATAPAATTTPVAPPAAKAPSPMPQVSVAVTRPSEAPTVRLPPMERNVPVTRPLEAPTVPSLPSARVGDIPGVPASSAEQPDGGETPRWARDLEGTLGNPPATAAGSIVSPPAKPASPVPSGGPTHATDAPVGLSERRQPPQPESVVMSGFRDEAKTGAGASGKRPVAVAIVVLLLLAAVGVGIYVAVARSSAPAPRAVRVRVQSPRPTAVYRWFTGRGVVVEEEPRTLGFESPGRVVELLPAGTEFGAGEIVGRLQGSAAIETLLAHHRSRLAFYNQMHDSMSAAGNQAETRQAELRRADKQRLIDETTTQLGRVTLRPREPGEVLDTMVKVGAVVKVGTPIARVKGRLLHGDFRLDAAEAAASPGPDGKLAFCRVEVIGLGPRASNAEPRRAGDPVADSGSPEAQNGPRFIDCVSPTRAGGKLTVGLPGDLGLVPGQPLRLARKRYDAVFPVPAAALGGEGTARTVWIATKSGTAEQRDVVVADVSDDDALVSQGLAVGDEVILDAPPTLTPGAPLTPER